MTTVRDILQQTYDVTFREASSCSVMKALEMDWKGLDAFFRDFEKLVDNAHLLRPSWDTWSFEPTRDQLSIEEWDIT